MKKEISQELEQLLTVDEVAAWLKVERRTILTRIKRRIYVKGVHYYSPRGTHPRFRVSAMMAWLEGRDDNGRSRRVVLEARCAMNPRVMTAAERLRKGEVNQ